jgi:hypothetical protein
VDDMQVDNLDLLIAALAAMSAQVGSIVVVFSLFAFEKVVTLREVPVNAEDYFLVLRERSRLALLLRVTGVAIVFLLITPVALILGIILSDNGALSVLVPAGLGAFTYSIASLLIALTAYLYLERPFAHVRLDFTAEQA